MGNEPPVVGGKALGLGHLFQAHQPKVDRHDRAAAPAAAAVDAVEAAARLAPPHLNNDTIYCHETSQIIQQAQ